MGNLMDDARPVNGETPEEMRLVLRDLSIMLCDQLKDEGLKSEIREHLQHVSSHHLDLAVAMFKDLQAAISEVANKYKSDKGVGCVLVAMFLSIGQQGMFDLNKSNQPPDLIKALMNAMGRLKQIDPDGDGEREVAVEKIRTALAGEGPSKGAVIVIGKPVKGSKLIN